MKSFDSLISSLRKLPGIGPKQAERLAFHLFRAPESETEALITSLREIRRRVRTCSLCFNYSESTLCSICADPGRDSNLLCVVEEPTDVTAIERSRGFRGRYHVLHGALSPLDGVGPESLRIRELLARLREPGCGVRELILAMDHDTEGDTTAMFLAHALADVAQGRSSSPIKVTRIALGVPMGGDLDYIDERTLSSALIGRREF